MGCYPLFACKNWYGLADDLYKKQNDWVSFSLVTDPFGRSNKQALKTFFEDKSIPFKDHFIVNLKGDWKNFINKSHLRKACKAVGTINIVREENPLDFINEWNRLYTNLIRRHQITGITRFSQKIFRGMFETPGLHVYTATLDGETIGMVLFYEMAGVVYYHLGAYSDVGYQQNASFGIFLRAIEDFANAGKTYLNLGAGAGLTNDANDGLSRFKKGWVSETKTAWFCGKVFNKEIYRDLTKSLEKINDYFPLYRAPGNMLETKKIIQHNSPILEGVL
jgi:Acetyltransferase (GNAT) domain